MFQGINTDVTVPESSIVLLRFRLESFLSLYAEENIFPGITIAKYWSEAEILTVKQLKIVLENKPVVDFAKLNK